MKLKFEKNKALMLEILFKALQMSTTVVQSVDSDMQEYIDYVISLITSSKSCKVSITANVASTLEKVTLGDVPSLNDFIRAKGDTSTIRVLKSVSRLKNQKWLGENCMEYFCHIHQIPLILNNTSDIKFDSSHNTINKLKGANSKHTRLLQLLYDIKKENIQDHSWTEFMPVVLKGHWVFLLLHIHKVNNDTCYIYPYIYDSLGYIDNIDCYHEQKVKIIELYKKLFTQSGITTEWKDATFYLKVFCNQSSNYILILLII